MDEYIWLIQSKYTFGLYSKMIQKMIAKDSLQKYNIEISHDNILQLKQKEKSIHLQGGYIFRITNEVPVVFLI